MGIQLDINYPPFQKQFFSLEQPELIALVKTFAKLLKLSWADLYKDKGLNWELIKTQTGPKGQRIYSIRVTEKFRAAVYRADDFLVFLSLHPDHDSAYR
jgi:hypothetical protein